MPGTNDTDPCSAVDDSETGMFYVLLLAQLIMGVGCTPMLTLAFVYLDENSSRGNSALLTGTSMANSLTNFRMVQIVH